MTALDLADPLVATYVIAATLIILKAICMPWLTVVRMMQEKGGFRSPEDLRKTSLNPAPNPGHLGGRLGLPDRTASPRSLFSRSGQLVLGDAKTHHAPVKRDLAARRAPPHRGRVDAQLPRSSPYGDQWALVVLLARSTGRGHAAGLRLPKGREGGQPGQAGPLPPRPPSGRHEMTVHRICTRVQLCVNWTGLPKA